MVSDDIPLLRPTLFISVPRLYNRIYDKIREKLSQATGCKGLLVRRAVRVKLENLKKHGTYTHACYDRLIFNKVKALLGGRVRTLVTGSAPIAADVMDFLCICFCAPMQEGYGMTETTGGAFLQVRTDPTAGNVGGPNANTKIRLRDIDEMGYLSTNDPPRGEICFKGSQVTPGYYANPEKTREAFDAEGWLLSGDVG